MKKFFVTSIAMLAILVGLTVGIPQTARAESGILSINLPGHSFACVNAVYAAYKVYTQGNAKPGVKFLVIRQGINVYSSPSDTTTAFSYQNPSASPGFYQFCAQNNESKSANVSLQIRTDRDAPY